MPGPAPIVCLQDETSHEGLFETEHSLFGPHHGAARSQQAKFDILMETWKKKKKSQLCNTESRRLRVEGGKQDSQ